MLAVVKGNVMLNTITKKFNKVHISIFFVDYQSEISKYFHYTVQKVMYQPWFMYLARSTLHELRAASLRGPRYLSWIIDKHRSCPQNLTHKLWYLHFRQRLKTIDEMVKYFPDEKLYPINNFSTYHPKKGNRIKNITSLFKFS